MTGTCFDNSCGHYQGGASQRTYISIYNKFREPVLRCKRLRYKIYGLKYVLDYIKQKFIFLFFQVCNEISCITFATLINLSQTFFSVFYISICILSHLQ